jgi:hypothetical protein
MVVFSAAGAPPIHVFNRLSSLAGLACTAGQVVPSHSPDPIQLTMCVACLSREKEGSE